MIRPDIKRWPHQIRGVNDVFSYIDVGVHRICMTSPTGGGKSFMIWDMIDRASSRGWQSILYTNRRMLMEQLVGGAEASGIDHGIRAAGYEPQLDKNVQISSIQTEYARTIKTGKWPLSPAKLVIIDEGHLNKETMAQELMNRHIANGAFIVMVTATPIDMSEVAEVLVVAGTMSELRECGALVPCVHVGVDEPDMRGFKPSAKTGEYSENDQVKAVMRPNVFGRVLEHYNRLNEAGKPTILFGPDVAGSVWFAERFNEQGIRSAHIDGDNCWHNGKSYESSPELRSEIAARSKEGSIKVVCNRFVLREGIDWPWIEHGIMACVMGVQSYIQAGGRLLRAYPGKQFATLQDHGGHWHRHGSLNADREWHLDYTQAMISHLRADRLRTKEEREPVSCPQCHKIRSSGLTCPFCGFVTSKRSRLVVQQDGELVEHVGDIYRPRPIQMKPNTAAVWERAYWRGAKTKMTFAQCEGLFWRENGYFPPRNLPFMPKESIDFHRRVCHVSRERLIEKATVEPRLFQ